MGKHCSLLLCKASEEISRDRWQNGRFLERCRWPQVQTVNIKCTNRCLLWIYIEALADMKSDFTKCRGWKSRGRTRCLLSRPGSLRAHLQDSASPVSSERTSIRSRVGSCVFKAPSGDPPGRKTGRFLSFPDNPEISTTALLLKWGREDLRFLIKPSNQMSPLVRLHWWTPTQIQYYCSPLISSCDIIVRLIHPSLTHQLINFFPWCQDV